MKSVELEMMGRANFSKEICLQREAKSGQKLAKKYRILFSWSFHRSIP
jgi:hypothetical protein